MARDNPTDRRFDDDAGRGSQRGRGDRSARYGRREEYSEEDMRSDQSRASGGQRGRRDLIEAGYTRENRRGGDDDDQDFARSDARRDDDAAWSADDRTPRRGDVEGERWNENGRGSNVGYRGSARSRSFDDSDQGSDRGGDASRRLSRADQGQWPDQDGEFDPDYTRWRDQQMRALDEDYRAFRTERAKSFGSDFEDFRKSRESAKKQTAGARKTETQSTSESQH